MFRLQIIQKYNLRIKALISSQNIQLQFLNGSEFLRCSNTGKVIFEWCKQVADNRDAPWPAQEPLPRQSAHVGHVRIVDWEAKDPDRKTSQTQNNQEDRQVAEWGEDTGKDHFEILIADRAVNGSLTDDIEAHIPLHLSAPEYVFLLVHVDREVLVLALLDGVRPGGDGPHFVKLTSERKNGTNPVFIIFWGI